MLVRGVKQFLPQIMKHRATAAAVISSVCILGLFGLRSKWFGTAAVPADYYPEGFAGVHVDSITAGHDTDLRNAALVAADKTSIEYQAIVGERTDGTPIFTRDALRFTDRVEGDIIIERPAVSFAEADRLGHDDSLRTIDALRTYMMRGPTSAGCTETDGRWLLELHHRHESSEHRATAVSWIALALLNNHQYDADSWSGDTRAELLETFESAINSSDPLAQAKALRMAEWDGWAQTSPTFVDSIRQAASGTGENADTARTLLVHIFGEHK